MSNCFIKKNVINTVIVNFIIANVWQKLVMKWKTSFLAGGIIINVLGLRIDAKILSLVLFKGKILMTAIWFLKSVNMILRQRNVLTKIQYSKRVALNYPNRTVSWEKMEYVNIKRIHAPK